MHWIFFPYLLRRLKRSRTFFITSPRVFKSNIWTKSFALCIIVLQKLLIRNLGLNIFWIEIFFLKNKLYRTDININRNVNVLQTKLGLVARLEVERAEQSWGGEFGKQLASYRLYTHNSAGWDGIGLCVSRERRYHIVAAVI